MRRLATSALCGSLTLLFTIASLAAAPAKRSGPAPRGAPTGAPAAAPRAGEPSPGEPGAEPGRRVAPRPKAYKLADPSPAVKKRAKRMNRDAKIMMYTGISLSGVGLMSTIAGAVLISVTDRQGVQRGGIIGMIVGSACIVAGVALWAVGRGHMNKAELLIIKAQLRMAKIVEPSGHRQMAYPAAHPMSLPKSQTVLSWQLRF